ncbi:WhiB-like iron-sulfur binding domain containing protein [uncultured Caudovirales phage]|uniref:WhiB-like iron-sulfur binding domain containing protein n=1 Tax=uncultured Caudovirales phage TaxID=2100421 RepID=A0A6J7WND8_9CAUD|nr:WhiB-like iron-sulfur binding domain containing protein [uncultured Caudovirales phage]
MQDSSSFDGVDYEDIEWYHLAACKGQPINWYYDDYEADKQLATQIDQVCMHCPVVKDCYFEGVKGKEKGVWGGVYMDLGRLDKQHNSHKTPEILKQLKKLHGKNTIHG